jgi:hypothetical protein
LWYAKFWKEEENPTAQARQNKVGVVRVSDSETGKENEISPTSRARQNQVGFLEVLVCKSFEKAKQVQVFTSPAELSWTYGGRLGLQSLGKAR